MRCKVFVYYRWSMQKGWEGGGGEEMEEEMFCRHITKDFFLTLPPDIDRDFKIRAGFAL